MGLAAFLEKMRPAHGSEMERKPGWFAAWIARLKTGVAEIAATKSSQRLGREEETER